MIRPGPHNYWDDDIFIERWANRPRRPPPPRQDFLPLAQKLVNGEITSAEFRSRLYGGIFIEKEKEQPKCAASQ